MVAMDTFCSCYLYILLFNYLIFMVFPLHGYQGHWLPWTHSMVVRKDVLPLQSTIVLSVEYITNTINGFKTSVHMKIY